MRIERVINFKNAWEYVCENNLNEIEEAVSTLEEVILNQKEIDGTSILVARDLDIGLYRKGWGVQQESQHMPSEGIMHAGKFGPIKNGVSVTFIRTPFETLSRWVFQISFIAVRDNFVKVPILFACVTNSFKNDDKMSRALGGFENFLKQLQSLAPLSHKYPFLIVGLSESEEGPAVQVFNLKSEDDEKNKNTVIDRFIEFPPEYYQAGLGILNYFGTYLRERCPEQNASVKIEQQGLKVRMIIEAGNGESEVIEEALHEYELIISGKERPERFSVNDRLILELKSELRIANVRIEGQKDIMGVQDARIDKLISIIGDSLSQKNNVSIDFRPNVVVSNTIDVNQYVLNAISSIHDLKGVLPEASAAHFMFDEVANSLAALEDEKDPDAVKSSSAMDKFKKILDMAVNTEGDLQKAIRSAESGWENLSKIASQYNRIAEWCGLPVVPKALIK